MIVMLFSLLLIQRFSCFTHRISVKVKIHSRAFSLYFNLPSISHLSPMNPAGQLHSNEESTFLQVPPLQHGALAHELSTMENNKASLIHIDIRHNGKLQL